MSAPGKKGGGKKGMRWTTGKECDGCRLRKGQVALKVVQRRDPITNVKLSLTFCRRCDALDQEAHGLAPPSRRVARLALGQ